MRLIPRGRVVQRSTDIDNVRVRTFTQLEEDKFQIREICEATLVRLLRGMPNDTY